MSDYNELHDKGKKILDDAVSEYIALYRGGDDPDMTEVATSVVTGWTIGIGLTNFGDDGEYDSHIMDSSPGLSNFTALGIAMVTNEFFKRQAFGDEDND